MRKQQSQTNRQSFFLINLKMPLFRRTCLSNNLVWFSWKNVMTDVQSVIILIAAGFFNLLLHSTVWQFPESYALDTCFWSPNRKQKQRFCAKIIFNFIHFIYCRQPLSDYKCVSKPYIHEMSIFMIQISTTKSVSPCAYRNSLIACLFAH